MKNQKIRIYALLLCIGMLLSCFPGHAAAEGFAEDLSDNSLVTASGSMNSTFFMFDGATRTPVMLNDGAWVELTSEKGISSLYFIFDIEYPEVALTETSTDTTMVFDTRDMAHAFADVEAMFGHPVESLKLTFQSGPAKLNELSVFSSGRVPEWVQVWDEPFTDGADLVLFSTHGDDEQLFFAGILPYYACERGYKVQVVYYTNHRNLEFHRVHEMLDGLWAVGIRSYPVFGTFPDLYSGTLQQTYDLYNYMGVKPADSERFVVENIRRFKPLVAVGHDWKNGEYGNGVHKMYADLLIRCGEMAADPDKYPESAEKYGTWQIPKTYLHLYEENQIVMDWDQPLTSFGGMTAFEVTKDIGWPKHVSQQSGFEYYYVGKKKASDITEYSPREFGLYSSTVGEDVRKNDFFENIDVENYRAQVG